MNSKRCILSVCVGLSLICMPASFAFCEETKLPEAAPVSVSADKVWTLEECLRHADENNPSIRSAREGLKAASGSNLMTLSEFMPRVGWTTMYVKNDKAALGSLGSSIPGLSPSMYSQDYYTSRLSADMTLFSWRMQPLRNTMRSTTRLAALKLAAAQNDLTLNVKKAFYTALYAKQSLLIARSAEDVANENLQTTESLYKIGRVSSFDVSRARVRMVNARTAVIAARNYETVSLEGLRMVLSQSSGGTMDIKGDFPQDTRNASLDEEIGAALKYRPELNSARQAESLQVSAKELARAGFLPTISAGFGYSWEGLDLIASKNDYFTSWTAKAGISIPLFDGLFSTGHYKAQKAGLRQAGELVQGASDGVLMEVRQYYYSLANASESLQAQKENVQTAGENLKIAQERYKMGLLSQLELKDAELSLIDARTQQVKALYDYNISLASLERAVGLPTRPDR